MHDGDKLRAVAHPGTERVFTAAEAKGAQPLHAQGGPERLGRRIVDLAKANLFR